MNSNEGDVRSAFVPGEPHGYAHPAYALTLGALGCPLALVESGGWLIERPIPGTARRDAVAPYPLLSCRDWNALADDLRGLAHSTDLVSAVAVIDPFAPLDGRRLALAFPDLVRPYKEHQVVCLDRPRERIASKHHRYYARRALRSMTVEPVADMARFAPRWAALYANLVARHRLCGVHAFPAKALGDQLAVPGVIAFQAIAEGEMVGAHVWYRQGGVAYSHLAASTERGYDLGASYALHWEALDHFGRAGVTWLDLGAAADGGRDGLLGFKAGWANATRTAYLCGRIFDRDAYRKITVEKGCTPGGYFPAYRGPVNGSG